MGFELVLTDCLHIIVYLHQTSSMGKSHSRMSSIFAQSDMCE